MPAVTGPIPQFASFPGIAQIVSARYTRSHGITPGVCTIEMAPQIGFTDIIGDLAFIYGPISVVFPDCRIDQQSIRRTERNLIWSLNILDRRWRWNYGSISGTYNTRQDDGTIDPTYQETPQQLATRLLKAMGEANFDVSQLPNNTFPFVQWEGEIPARALASLCDSLGCRVILTVADEVVIVVAGQGDVLPEDLPLVTDSLTISAPITPDSLLLMCGKTRFQIDFALEAVGQDTDGTIKPIDQLSYTPPKGWANEVPDYFPGVTSDRDGFGNVPRDFARRTVWRWYQIRVDINNDGSEPFTVPDYGPDILPVEDVKQLLPLEDMQVLTAVNSDGVERSLPAVVYGVFFTGDIRVGNTPLGTIYYKGFSVDTERGIVQFADPVYALFSDTTKQPAEITLRTACSVRTFDTFSWARYRVQYFADGKLVKLGPADIPQRGPLDTGPRVLAHDEIIYQVTGLYDQFGSGGLSGFRSNQKDVLTEVNYYLSAVGEEYNVKLPQEITYAGIRNDIDLDGAIQQITWTVGPAFATTRVSRNDEHDPYVAPYRARRIQEELHAEKVKQLKELADHIRARPEEMIARLP